MKLSDYDDPIDWSFWGKVALCFVLTTTCVVTLVMFSLQHLDSLIYVAKNLALLFVFIVVSFAGAYSLQNRNESVSVRIVQLIATILIQFLIVIAWIH